MTEKQQLKTEASTLPTTLMETPSRPNPNETTMDDDAIPKSFPKRLALPNDNSKLSPLHCFLRQDLLEIFVVGRSLKKTPMHSPESSVGRVGLRCVFCARERDRLSGKIPDDEAPMAVFYPKSIAEIYRLIISWQRCHLRKCRNLPPDLRSKWTMLREKDKSRGKTQYWLTSAQEVGLVDCQSRAGGIRFASSGGGAEAMKTDETTGTPTAASSSAQQKRNSPDHDDKTDTTKNLEQQRTVSPSNSNEEKHRSTESDYLFKSTLASLDTSQDPLLPSNNNKRQKSEVQTAQHPDTAPADKTTPDKSLNPPAERNEETVGDLELDLGGVDDPCWPEPTATGSEDFHDVLATRPIIETDGHKAKTKSSGGIEASQQPLELAASNSSSSPSKLHHWQI